MKGTQIITIVALGWAATAKGATTSLGCDDVVDGKVEWDVARNGDTIPYKAFYFCGALKSITIPHGVKTIENEAFKKTGLTSVTLPDDMTKVGSNAFECSSWIDTYSITIGNSAPTTVGAQAFYDCPVTCYDSQTDHGAIGSMPTLPRCAPSTEPPTTGAPTTKMATAPPTTGAPTTSKPDEKQTSGAPTTPKPDEKQTSGAPTTSKPDEKQTPAPAIALAWAKHPGRNCYWENHGAEEVDYPWGKAVDKVKTLHACQAACVEAADFGCHGVLFQAATGNCYRKKDIVVEKCVRDESVDLYVRPSATVFVDRLE